MNALHGIIDAFVNIPVPAEQQLVPKSPAVIRWFSAGSPDLLQGSTVDDLIVDMDRCGIEAAILSVRNWWHHPASRPVGPLATSHGIDDDLFDSFCEEGAHAVAAHPGRFHGSVMIDPMGGMAAVRQLERAVKEYGFIACRLFPATTGVRPNDPLCYPIYTKCIELGIPVVVQMGVPGPNRSALLQQPMLLDEILLTYPELTVIGAHIGFPWHLETVALLQKHPNFYLMTSGWAPRYIPAEIIHFLKTRGKQKVMWASDYPLLPMDRAVKEALELELEEEVQRRFLTENCREVFRL